jgi:hypothetical protein
VTEKKAYEQSSGEMELLFVLIGTGFLFIIVFFDLHALHRGEEDHFFD